MAKGKAMEYQDYYSLEFIGGPYDGYKQSVAIPHENLLEVVSLPVNRNVLQVIQGEAPGRESPTRSVAHYELRNEDGQWQYHYVRSYPPGELDWDQWCTKVCQAWRKYHQETSASQEYGERDY